MCLNDKLDSLIEDSGELVTFSVLQKGLSWDRLWVVLDTPTFFMESIDRLSSLLLEVDNFTPSVLPTSIVLVDELSDGAVYVWLDGRMGVAVDAAYFVRFGIDFDRSPLFLNIELRVSGRLYKSRVCRIRSNLLKLGIEPNGYNEKLLGVVVGPGG